MYISKLVLYALAVLLFGGLHIFTGSLWFLAFEIVAALGVIACYLTNKAPHEPLPEHTRFTRTNDIKDVEKAIHRVLEDIKHLDSKGCRSLIVSYNKDSKITNHFVGDIESCMQGLSHLNMVALRQGVASGHIPKEILEKAEEMEKQADAAKRGNTTVH